jgi:SAM-dependent methyltransferase
VQPEDLSAKYEESWADAETNVAETGSTDRILSRIYAEQMKASLGLADLRGMRILEIGAGKGAMALELEAMGATVWAVEPYGYAALKTQGVKVVRDESELPSAARFDGILGMQVIEHLPSPGARISGLRSLLVDGGWILLSTPNRNGLNARIAGGRWREAQKDTHLLLFDECSIRRLLEAAGYSGFRRLRWLHGYGRSGLRRCLPYALQSVRLDGELAVLAYSRGKNSVA